MCVCCVPLLTGSVFLSDRSILAQPSLYVTPGSPPDEIPDPFESTDVRSATCHKTAETGSDIYSHPSPVTAGAVLLDGEPPPGSPAPLLSLPQTPANNAHRRGSSTAAVLKFDTPERTEVEEHGLETHPEVPVLGRGAFGTVVLGRRRGWFGYFFFLGS